jgi:signal transduction histidine kinase
MRGQIEESNRALLEQERLATIGRMANSVSHDLRHYLASVYANAEFLSSPALSAKERLELYEEIRLAVHGTTEMLDSLLIFSRSGKTLQRIPASFESLAERAIALVKVHPDAVDVAIRLEPTRLNTVVTVDPKQIERALYNLLLNACQAAREAPEKREVVVRLIEDHTIVGATITDSGAGVPEDIRDILFDPFISRGKQKGTGLGLTLAWSVAREHGGEVELVQSVYGETVFRLTVRRGAGEGHDEHMVSSGTEVP